MREVKTVTTVRCDRCGAAVDPKYSPVWPMIGYTTVYIGLSNGDDYDDHADLCSTCFELFKAFWTTSKQEVCD